MSGVNILLNWFWVFLGLNGLVLKRNSWFRVFQITESLGRL